MPTFLSAAVFAALAPAAVCQVTIEVPGDYATIGAAIAAASQGDTVLVDPGVYFERIDFIGKDITVESRDGAATTFIDAQRLGTVVQFVSAEGPSAVLMGFTLTGGLGPVYTAGGILCRGSDPTVTNCVITGCEGGPFGDMWLDTAGAGAIGCFASGSSGAVAPTFERCVLVDNLGGAGEDSSPGGPGAVRCGASAAPRFVECRIEDNVGGHSRGFFLAQGGSGAVRCKDGHPVFERCQIRSNRGGDATLAVYRDAGAGGLQLIRGSATLIDCLVVGNEGGRAVVDNSLVHGVGGMLIFQADLTMTGTVLASNIGSVGGARIRAVDVPITATLTNCTLVGNQGSQVGGLLLLTAQPVSIVNTILWGNEDFNGLASDLRVTAEYPVVTHCVVKGDFPGEGNIDTDPPLVDIAGWDYHLRANTP